MRRHHLSFVSALLFSVALIACGGDGDDGDVDAGGPTTSDTTTTEATTTTEGPRATQPEDVELPGEPWDGFPSEGAELAVVGVESDDMLNVRSGPGVEFGVVAELEPLATGVTATGVNRMLDGAGIWAQVDVDGVTGWANYAFLTHLGATDDITSQLFPEPADRPSAGTMEQLSDIVVQELLSEGPPPTVTVAAGPDEGDLTAITVDARGLRDDAAGGYRLVIFAEQGTTGGYAVRSVESTVHCTRGVVEDGLCL